MNQVMSATLVTVAWVMGIGLLVLIVYSGLPNLWVRLLRRSAIRTVESPGCVALTFDDGPDPNYTPRLLDALHTVGVKATFFVIADKAIDRPDIVLRMLNEGHDVQVHGYKHWLVPFLTPRRTRLQVVGASSTLRSHFGIDTSWYRPTWGLTNAVTLLSRTCRSHRLVTWSVMVGDWQVTEPKVLLDRIMQKLRPGGIIVLHDSDETWGAQTGAPESVIELIPLLAENVHARGLRFVRIADQIVSRRDHRHR